MDLFESSIVEKGYFIQRSVFSNDFVDRLSTELEEAIAKEDAFHGTGDHVDHGMLIACPIYGGGFLEVLDNQAFLMPFEHILGKNCIVYVYTSSSLPPHSTNASACIHVDRPKYIPGYIESVASLIALTDFTADNGATYYLPKSQNLEEKPDEQFFYENALRLEIPKGSVFYFNPRLWHAGGVNSTEQWRHSVGISMVRPFYKQRIDLPNAMQGMDLTHVSKRVKQKLGFLAVPPSSLSEYYLPRELRPYSQGSEWEDSENFRLTD
jgi:ectoine hydroxylase-related dioxygenase (phytanoyl-CoA dioxygenase family)